MDTRSVVRSRRRSTRLTGQSPQYELVHQPATRKRRASSHDTSAKPKQDASHEAHGLEEGSNSKNTSSAQKARSETPESFATKKLTKNKDKGIIFPLIPNLNSSKTPSPQSTKRTTVSDASSSKVSGDVSKDHVSTKWVKTARGSIRPASSPPADDTKHSRDRNDGDAEKGQEAQIAVVRRRSSRLASMTPDVEDVAKTTSKSEPMTSQTRTKKDQALTTAASLRPSLGSYLKQELISDSKDTSTRATPEEDSAGSPGHQPQLPIRDRRSQRLMKDPKLIEDTSPIPELVADIETIILSSPVPNESAEDAGTRDTIPPTLPRGLASAMDRSSTLRSSKSSAESKLNSGIMKKSERLLDTGKSDSESSQVDGAYNDSIRRQKQEEVQAARSTANKPTKSSVPRGTKRPIEELSQDEGDADTPRVRRRRLPDSDKSKREVDLSSANPIETATSRDSFSVGDSSVESPLDVGEFARRTDEPVNPVLLAQMLNTHPERMDSATAASAPYDDGWQSTSQPQVLEDTHTCADCGRAPERYLACARCQQAVYCGKYCQIWNWPIHKTRCGASDGADQAEVEVQEAYLRDMWSAALRLLREEQLAGGTLESVLLGEAVRHSRTRPRFMGRESVRGFVGSDVDASQSASVGGQSLDGTHAMSMRLAQAAQEAEGELSEAE